MAHIRRQKLVNLQIRQDHEIRERVSNYLQQSKREKHKVVVIIPELDGFELSRGYTSHDQILDAVLHLLQVTSF